VRRAAPVAVLLASLFTAATAHSDDLAPEKPSPYRFRLSLDAPLVGLSTAGALVAFVEPNPPSCLDDCEPPASMPGIDERVLGRHSPRSHSAADLTVLALSIVPHVANAVVTGPTNRAWFEDAAITAEAILFAQALTQVTKVAVGRQAPIVYDETVPLEERTSRDAVRSFWSGHTATAFAAATSFTVSYWLRHSRDPWKWVVLATLESAALSVGLLKIRAGYHYPTDIAAGALCGISSGLLVPFLHTSF
jgi:membrane-associated phospholipid phosphatase